MRATRIFALSALLTIFFASQACNSLTGKPSVTNIRMATDDTGNTTTTVYAGGDDFYVFADLNGLHVGSLVEAKWFAVTSAGWEPNSELNISDYTYQPPTSSIYFRLTTPDGSDWPSGSYKVDLYLDGILTGEQIFSVK